MHPIGALFTGLILLLATGLFAYALWQPTGAASNYATATYYAAMAIAAYAAAGVVAFLATRARD